MTTPQQPQPAAPQQPDIVGDVAEATLVTAVGTALIQAITVPAAMTMLAGMIRVSQIPRQALFSVLQVVMSHPPGQTGMFGPATTATERMNLQRRAQFVVAAARRVGAAITQARSEGRSVPQALADAIQRERRFYAQHLIATWQRSAAGAQVDMEAATRGLLLGWHATRDKRTSAECLAANGKNFYAGDMPVIGYPGAVHPHCRCQAGAAFPGASLLPSYGMRASRYRRAA